MLDISRLSPPATNADLTSSIGSKPDLTACRIQQSTGEILKLEANLSKMLLGFVIVEGSDDVLQRKTAVDNGLQTIGRYRPNHILLICSAANGDPADTNLI